MSNSISITINIDRSECIRQGMAYRGGTQPVDIDLDALTAEERAELANLWDGNKIYAYDSAYSSNHPRCLPTQSSLIEMLRGGIARRAELAQLHEARRLAEKLEAEAAAQRALALPLHEWYDLAGAHFAPRPELSYSGNSEAYDAVPGITERRAEARAGFEQKLAERRAESARLEQEATDRKLAAGLALKTWALAHGSDWIRMLIEGGYRWIELAEDEFVAAHVLPGYGEPIAVSRQIPAASPSIEAIRALNETRATIADNPIYRNPVLSWNEIEESTDEDGEIVNQAEEFYSITVEVVLPNGHTQTIERKL